MPIQKDPHAPVQWQAYRLTGQGALAARASRKLRNDELLVTAFAATLLRMELDRVPLWRGDHVEIKQLVEDFTRYLYLPRLREPEVLLEAIRDGLRLLTWQQDAFGYAESYDEKAKRYRGLRGGQNVAIPDSDAPGLLVRPVVAEAQAEAEVERPPSSANLEAVNGKKRGGQVTGASDTGSSDSGSGTTTAESPKPRRFHGAVALDPVRVGRDAGTIADEVISHLAGIVGAEVEVTLEIEAKIPEGANENVVRTVTENCRTLKFKDQGFERD